MQGGTEILSVILQRQFVQAMGRSPGIFENFNIVLKILRSVFQSLCEKGCRLSEPHFRQTPASGHPDQSIKQLTDILRAHSGSKKIVRDFMESLV